MAQYNEILEGGLNQVIVKRLGMQTGTAVPAVQPEMTMDLTLESDRPEWGFLKGEYRFGAGTTTVVPAAGEHAYVGIQNPANSGNLVVIERVFSGSTGSLGTTTVTPPVAAGVTARRIDTRTSAGGSAAPTTGAIPTASLPTRSELILANTDFQLPYIIAPGNWFLVWNNTAAASLQASIRWRERPGLPGELG